MKIKAGQLAAALKNDLAPCYLVSGDEHLLVAEATDAIRRAARDRDFTERDLYVATSGFDWEQLRMSGSNLSLFAEKRIVELRLPTGKPGVTGARVIADLAESAGSDLLLIVFFLRYQNRPIHFFGTLGLVIFGSGAVIDLYLLVLKLLGNEIWGKPLLLLGIMLTLGGIQIITIGILSEILMRTYYESQQKKPYRVKRTIIREK